MRLTLAAALTTALVGLVACGNAPVAPTEPGTQKASDAVGSVGGVVSLPNGSSVSVPSGALAKSATVTMEIDTSDQGRAHAPAAGYGTPASDLYLLGPEGQQFESPVTVKIAIDSSLLSAGDTIQDVVVFTAPRDSDDYMPLLTTVVDSMTVSVQVSHFSHFVALMHTLGPGEYASVATSVGDSPYIGDYENNYGYVLGYLLPGARVYARNVKENSIYGLIFDGHYGAWDHGHHCGWVSLDKMGGRTVIIGSGTSHVADSCPDPFHDPYFSLAQGQPKGIFKAGSWEECDGCVQPAIVLPTCTGADLTVYANYDPETQTFSDPDGEEVAGRGTMEDAEERSASGGIKCSTYTVASGPNAGLSPGEGYCGFGTRFETPDGLAVEIKDTRRHGKNITAFGFMHSYCIAGAKVGAPAGELPCGTVEPGHHVFSGGASFPSCNGEYALSIDPANGELVETQPTAGTVESVVGGKPGDVLSMQTDGNLVMYEHGKAIWASKTEGHPGARLLVGNDGVLKVYYLGKVLWSWKPSSHAVSPTHCCAKCASFPVAYYAGDVPGLSCAAQALAFCAGEGAVESAAQGTCGDEP